MPKPLQTKLIGGVSLLLGIAVLVASSLFLHESSYNKCYGGRGGGYGQGGYQNQSPHGGVHGGHVPYPEGGHDHYRNRRDVEPSERSGDYVQAHAHGGYNPPIYTQPQRPDSSSFEQVGYDGYGQKPLGSGRYCTEVIRKYRTCAIIGIVASILQIIISAVYCFANKNTLKALSLGWAGTHFIIIVAYIATAGVVLAEKRFEEQKGYNRNNYGDEDDFPAKKLAFAIISLIAAFFLILMILFACLTLKNSDYDDYAVDPKEKVVTRKKFLES